MSISISGNIARIGSFKSGTTGLMGVNTVVAATGTFDSSDVGRLIAVIPDPLKSKYTQIRKIVSYQSTSEVTVHDNWTNDVIPASGIEWRLAHNCQDVADIGNPLFQSVGDGAHVWDGEWEMSAGGFFGDTDISLFVSCRATVYLRMYDDSIVQLGLLWGGENSACLLYTSPSPRD